MGSFEKGGRLGTESTLTAGRLARFGGVSVPVELVIFDCDGVLINSESLAVRIDREVLAELGWELTEAQVAERFMGRSNEDIGRDIEAHLGRPLGAPWNEICESRYRAAFAAELRAIEGVVDALDEISVPTCVASSSTHAGLRQNLRMVGLYERFAGRLFSSEDVARGKPAPDLFLHAAARMEADPARCVVVEDSLHGVAAARAAGMRVLAFAGGLVRPEALAGSATTVFDQMRALPALLEAL